MNYYIKFLLFILLTVNNIVQPSFQLTTDDEFNKLNNYYKINSDGIMEPTHLYKKVSHNSRHNLNDIEFVPHRLRLVKYNANDRLHDEFTSGKHFMKRLLRKPATNSVEENFNPKCNMLVDNVLRKSANMPEDAAMVRYVSSNNEPSKPPLDIKKNSNEIRIIGQHVQPMRTKVIISPFESSVNDAQYRGSTEQKNKHEAHELLITPPPKIFINAKGNALRKPATMPEDVAMVRYLSSNNEPSKPPLDIKKNSNEISIIGLHVHPIKVKIPPFKALFNDAHNLGTTEQKDKHASPELLITPPPKFINAKHDLIRPPQREPFQEAKPKNLVDFVALEFSKDVKDPVIRLQTNLPIQDINQPERFKFTQLPVYKNHGDEEQQIGYRQATTRSPFTDLACNFKNKRYSTDLVLDGTPEHQASDEAPDDSFNKKLSVPKSDNDIFVKPDKDCINPDNLSEKRFLHPIFHKARKTTTEESDLSHDVETQNSFKPSNDIQQMTENLYNSMEEIKRLQVNPSPSELFQHFQNSKLRPSITQANHNHNHGNKEFADAEVDTNKFWDEVDQNIANEMRDDRPPTETNVLKPSSESVRPMENASDEEMHHPHSNHKKPSRLIKHKNRSRKKERQQQRTLSDNLYSLQLGEELNIIPRNTRKSDRIILPIQSFSELINSDSNFRLFPLYSSSNKNEKPVEPKYDSIYNVNPAKNSNDLQNVTKVIFRVKPLNGGYRPPPSPHETFIMYPTTNSIPRNMNIVNAVKGEQSEDARAPSKLTMRVIKYKIMDKPPIKRDTSHTLEIYQNTDKIEGDDNLLVTRRWTPDGKQFLFSPFGDSYTRSASSKKPCTNPWGHIAPVPIGSPTITARVEDCCTNDVDKETSNTTTCPPPVSIQYQFNINTVSTGCTDDSDDEETTCTSTCTTPASPCCTNGDEKETTCTTTCSPPAKNCGTEQNKLKNCSRKHIKPLSPNFSKSFHAKSPPSDDELCYPSTWPHLLPEICPPSQPDECCQLPKPKPQCPKPKPKPKCKSILGLERIRECPPSPCSSCDKPPRPKPCPTTEPSCGSHPKHCEVIQQESITRLFNQVQRLQCKLAEANADRLNMFAKALQASIPTKMLLIDALEEMLDMIDKIICLGSMESSQKDTGETAKNSKVIAHAISRSQCAMKQLVGEMQTVAENVRDLTEEADIGLEETKLRLSGLRCRLSRESQRMQQLQREKIKNNSKCKSKCVIKRKNKIFPFLRWKRKATEAVTLK